MAIATARGAPEPVADLIRRALILGADHELDPTTNAVRAAATGIIPYSAILVGLIAGRGQKLRVGRAEATRRFLREVTVGDRPETVVSCLFLTGESIPAFDHVSILGTGDPRAEALLAAFETGFQGDVEYDRFRRAVAIAGESTGVGPLQD